MASVATDATAALQSSPAVITNRDELIELVRMSMELRFNAAAFSPETRLEMVQSVQHKMRQTARDMLADTDVIDGDETQCKPESVTVDDLLTVSVSPPSAFFEFRENGRMHLPLIDWSAFRGYSMAFWIHVDRISTVKPDEKVHFDLFRYTNASGTLGVDATLEIDNAQGVKLTVRSCAPHGGPSEHKRNNFGAAVVAAIAPTATNTPSSDWKQVSHRIHFRERQWHLLVITHSLHYVKKSRVTCYLDAQQQFSEELVYPSGLIQATKAALGGGANAIARIASATMYHEELPKSIVETIFLHGPSICLFRRWMSVPTGATTQHMTDVREFYVPSPFCGPTEADVARIATASKLQAVFSFNAQDDISGHEDVYADRSVEWIAEGVVGSCGKWLSLESVNSTSEIQQRNARLGKNVRKVAIQSREIKTAWFRLLGVDALPVLLDYILTATESLMKEFSTGDDGEKALFLQTTIEMLTTDALGIFRGLLLNHIGNIHQALKTYLIHQFNLVIRRHLSIAAFAWTPTNIVACVDIVAGMLKMAPRNLIDGRDANHPTQPSVWLWNPIFASAVRAWLLDFRVWTKLSYKSQSIFSHQLYRLACEHPKLLNDLNIVSRLLEVLHMYYLSGTQASPTKDKGGSTTQNSKYSGDTEKEQHWKLQCIQTIMETLEVCLVSQSVHVHEALEQEIMETTFARAAASTPSPVSPLGPSSSGTAESTAEAGSADSVAASQRRKGGVFSMNLENIIWSDQSTSQSSASDHRGHLSSEDRDDNTSASSALPYVQIRFSLLRDLRAIIRFMVACGDAQVCSALLQLTRRLSVAYLDLRFGFISSNVIDAVLRVLSTFAKRRQFRSNERRRDVSRTALAADVCMSCVPIQIYFLDWLESVEGRTVWCGLEEHLRSVLSGEGNYTRGFLELMMEFYFDPTGMCGVQQSIVMNDPSKKDSVLFPLSPVHSSKSQNSLMHDSGIVVMTDDGFRTEADGVSGSGSDGLSAWIKLATSFCGRKLSLSWEKRVQIVRMAALRTLSESNPGSSHTPPDGSNMSPPRQHDEIWERNSLEIKSVYDKGVNAILSLPLKSILPFLPVLLVNTSTPMRDRVLMEISVKLKTDDANQDHQILMTKRDWIEALLELCVVCNSGSNDLQDGDQASFGITDESTVRRTADRAAAYSFDAHKTGEDLVVDAIVSLLCAAMQHPRGWRAFIDLIAALKVMQRKYSPNSATDDESKAAAVSSSIPPVLPDLTNASKDLPLLAHPLDWLGRITGIVLQKMARSRTILSKVLTENVHKVLVLIQEALLSSAHQHCPVSPSTSGENAVPQRASGRYVWSEAQLFLLNAVLDMCARLVDSTHKAYRSGLVPGLQILQASLSYIPANGAALVERITRTMESAFQQELNTASAVRVFDHLTPRDVFLSALVCLRRALLVQQGCGPGESELCDALQLLILKLCTSEVFLEDLHNNGLTVHDLSDMSEENAVAAVLDALGAAMNEAEMHEREEEADFIPLFPQAKELRDLTSANDENVDDVQQELDLDPDPFAIAFAGSNDNHPKIVPAFDENLERSVWAALEVEENRMLESLKEVAQREIKRQDRVRDELIPRRDKWTNRLWDVQEFKFRSQHARSLLPSPVASMILKEYSLRVGLYEAPIPGRLRKPFDPDFPMADLLYGSTDGPDSGAHVDDNRHRRFSLPLEMHGLSDGKSGTRRDSSDSGTSTSLEDDGHRLLERVGRVVAAQGGGEIQDITTEGATLPEGAVPNLDGDENVGANQAEGSDSPTKRDNEPDTGAEDENDQQEEADIPRPSISDDNRIMSSLRSASLPSGLWHVDTERHKESGLDPSEGMALGPGEEILAQAKCRRVLPEGMVIGNLYFCAKVLVFVPVTIEELEATGTSSSNDEIAPGLRRCWRWKYKHISAVFLRRFRLRDSALELFLQNGTTHFLDFPHVVKQQRNEIVRLLCSFLPRSALKQWPGRSAMSSLNMMTKAWQNRQISNYEYLMALNTFAGRSFNDLTQYPVFPWVIQNYESDVLDLSNPDNFRDLSKPMGALNPERLQEFWERYNSFDDPVIPKFLYGSHYSTCAGVVLFFLVRMQPFAQLHKKMQGGTFDLPDRLFYSIHETWNMCNSQMSEVKELTPEFYSDPSFLKNVNKFEFGKRHDQLNVNDVMLPKWANGSPEEFVRLHRAALESEYVSQHLHEWVDLIFGFKQRGKAALKANNVFYYLTYYGVVDLDRIEDPFIRESMELQIAHFGQCPMQLFNNPHPRRTPTTRRVSGIGKEPAAFPISSLPPPGTSGSTNTLASPSVRSPIASPAVPIGTSFAKPLSSMFQDISTEAQEHRRNWSPTIVVKPLATSAVRWIKVYPDRFLTINELGVIELYFWKLTPKPAPPVLENPGSSSALAVSTQGESEEVLVDGPGTPAPLPEHFDCEETNLPPIPVSVRTTSEGSIGSTVVDASVEGTVSDLPQPSGPACPWLLEVARDDSPFDVVPRIPVFEDTSAAADAYFPVTSSLNGRVLISGGAPNGSIQLRLVDLDNGHVVAKASVTGHDGRVTCLSVDRFSYHNVPVGNHQSDGDEILVSGSVDTTLAVWRLSRTKPDLLFRPPRITSCPMMVLRGHKLPLVDCAVNTYLNIVASCSREELLVHFLHDDGAVAFGLSAHEVQRDSVFVNITVSSKGFVVALVRWMDESTPETSSACVVMNLAGVVVLKQVFEGESVSRLQLSTEGDLVILTVGEKGMIRMCRLDDFGIVQEYQSSNVEAPICVASFGPDEATFLAITGHADGSMVLHLLPDADGSVSLLTNLRRLLGVSSKLKMVKGTVQQAQNLAWTTLGNAKAVTSTARDIAGEAIGEAKSIVKGFFSYLRQSSGTGGT